MDPFDRHVIVIGDLNVDLLSDPVPGDTGDSVRAGGTAINGARALRGAGFAVTVVGAVGADDAGAYLRAELDRLGVGSQLVTAPAPTGTCRLSRRPGSGGRRSTSDTSANAVDPADIVTAVRGLAVGADDVIVVATHVLVRHPPRVCRSFFADLHRADGILVVDLVPHDLGDRVDRDTVISCVHGASLLIAELQTVRAVLDRPMPGPDDPVEADWADVFSRLAPRVVALRHGRFGIEYESVAHTNRPRPVRRPTGYQDLSDARGFGDRLTATLLRSLV